MSFERTTDAAKRLSAGVITAAAILTLCASAHARPVLLERAEPQTRVGLDAVYLSGDAFNGLNMVVDGGYAFSDYVSAEVAIPLGFTMPDQGDSETLLGNIDVAGRAGAGFDFGAVSLQVGGALHLYLPTANGDDPAAQQTLSYATFTRPGIRSLDTFTIQPAVAASVGIAIVDVYASLGTSILIGTGDNSGTDKTVEGGLGASVALIPMLELFVEFANQRMVDSDLDTQRQLAFGIALDPPVIDANVNMRIPLDEATRDLLPWMLGAQVAATF